MKPSVFKAYDIRGKYPDEFNGKDARVIAEALGRFFKKGKIVLGHDGRTASPALYRAVCSGLNDAHRKRDVVAIDLGTTPMFYYFVHTLHASGGIMVTASHNPKKWNGLKVLGKQGALITGKDVKRILYEHHLH